jgi:hypothetical protein
MIVGPVVVNADIACGQVVDCIAETMQGPRKPRLVEMHGIDRNYEYCAGCRDG